MLLPSALGFSPHPPVSVYGTGILQTIAAFLDSQLTCFPTSFRSTSRLQIEERICQLFSYLACTGLSIPGSRSLPVSPTVLLQDSTGISTCYPSTTSFDLALGPDLPRADQLYSGNLRYSAGRIPTFLSLLIPAFSLLKIHSSFRYCFVSLRMLLYQLKFINSKASAVCFSPGHFRRRTSRLVSYYALFEWMAASEPTS